MLYKRSRKGKLIYLSKFLVMKDHLYALILEKRRIKRRVGENWIRRNARVEFEKLWPYKVTIVERRKVFDGIVFSNDWLRAFLKRKYFSLR